MRLFVSTPDLQTAAIVDRLRSILGGHRVELLAEALSLPQEPLRNILEARQLRVDVKALLDVVAALVHQWGMDPQWLLSGEYDGNLHRAALVLGEDRSSRGADAVRELVEDAFGERHQSPLLVLPLFREFIS